MTAQIARNDPPLEREEDRDRRGRILEEFEMFDGGADEAGGAGSSSDELPRIDGGWGAWSYLAAATGLETLVWGFANSYGVYLDRYEALYPSSTSLLAVVGTIAVGEMYLLLSPLTLWLTAHPRYRSWVMWAGLVLLCTGLLGAAFAGNASTVLVTQGVLYGLGGTMLYCPATNYMFQWWSRRRGFATGIMFAGTGAGGLVMPLVSTALLQRYGKRTTLVAIGTSYTIILALLIPYVRPRIPLPRASAATRSPKIDWSFLRHRVFWLFWAGILFQGLAAFVPGTYLPSYATALSLSPTLGTLSVALMNLARVPGQVVLGYLSDHSGLRKLIAGISAASALSVFAGWGAATNTGGLVAFSLAFGAVAGSFTALFPRFISVINHDDPHLPPILYALFSLARGLGSICSGFIAAGLISANSLSGSKGGYGVGDFGVLIIWTGVALVASGCGAGYKGFKVE